MTKNTQSLILVIVVMVLLGLSGKANAQFNETYSPPNNPPRVELVCSTNPTYIDEVVFEGLQAITPSTIEKHFREQLAGLTKNALLVPANVQKGAKIIAQLLADVGFMNAQVEFRIESVSAKSKRIRFIVDEGPPTVIRDIQFEGNKVFTDDELLSQLELVTVMSHDVYDRATLEYDLNKPRNFMRSRGYLQARILEPKLNAVNGNLTISIPVDEGKLYRIGEITVLGSKRFSAGQIVELAGLKRGDVADGKRISNFLFEELKNLYADIGYPQYSAEPDLEYKDNPDIANEGIVDFKITIDEGACYKIGAIEFQVNEKLTEKELWRFLLFKEGDTYNQQLIRESIKEMNVSGLFEPIDCEGDVEYLLNEDTNLARIVITVRAYRGSNE